MGLKGDLKSFGLPELFQSLTINQHSGLLVLRSPLHEIGVFFTYGEISSVSLGKNRVLRLGELLLREGKLTRPQLEEALEQQKNMAPRKRLGEILIEKAILTERELLGALTTKMEEEIYDIFFWEKADFEFLRDVSLEKGDIPPEFRGAVQVGIDTPTLVIEAMHRLDNWDKFKSVIVSFDEIFVLENRKSAAIHKIRSQFYFDPLFLDGKHTLRDISQTSLATLYEVFKGVVELHHQNLVRRVSGEELLSLAREKFAQKNFPSALAFYERALVLFPERGELQGEMARTLEGCGEKGKAGHHWLTAGKLFLKGGDHQKALSCSSKIAEASPIFEEGLELTLQCSMALDQKDKALEIGNRLGKGYLEEEKFEKARQIYLQLTKMIPTDGTIKELLAQAYLGENNIGPASKIYENLALAFEAKGKRHEALQFYKKVLSIDPDKPFIETKIETLTQKIHQAERRKKLMQKLAVGGVIFLVLLAVGVLWIVRGMKNKEAMSVWEDANQLAGKMDHAIRQKNFRKFSDKDLTTLQKKVKKILSDYPDTPAGVKARAFQLKLKKNILIFAKLYQEHQDKLRIAELSEKGYIALQKEIRRLTLKKKFQKIHQKEIQFIEKYKKTSWVKKLDFPILITTTPPGATLRLATRKFKTPEVAYYKFSNKKIKLRISKWGYQSETYLVNGRKFQTRHFDLKKTSIFTYPPLGKGGKPPLGPLVLPPIRLKNMISLISRDGFLYQIKMIFYPESVEVKLNRTLKVGSRGGTFTSFAILNFQNLLLARTNGVIILNSQAPKILAEFPSPKESSSLPPKIGLPFNFTTAPFALDSQNSRFCLANANGQIYFFRAYGASLNYLSSFPTLEPVVGGFGRSRDTLYFGTWGGRVYGLNTRRFPPKINWIRLLEGKILMAPLVYGNYLLIGTHRGEMVLLDRFTGKRTWDNGGKFISGGLVHPGLQMGQKFFLPTGKGDILEGEISNPPLIKALPQNFGKITSPFLYTRGYLFFGFQKDSKYFLCEYDVNKKKIFWKFSFPQAILAPPMVDRNYILVSCSDGRLYAFLR